MALIKRYWIVILIVIAAGYFLMKRSGTTVGSSGVNFGNWRALAE